MQIDYLAESLKYDRAAAECFSIVGRLRRERNRIADVKNDGEDAPPHFDHYDLVIDALNSAKQSFTSESEKYFRMHKQSSEIDREGAYNLIAAIAKSWAEDYEAAISAVKKDDAEIEKLKGEAENLVTDSVLKRIERTHAKFVKMAHDKLQEIIEDTNNAYKYRTTYGVSNHNGEHMRNRCPLCSGGMYAKRMKSDLFLVKCTGCYLSEIVKVNN